MNEYPNLFRPIKLGDVTFRNRIFQAPTSAPNLSPEGYFTLDSIAFFESIAAGGAAAVTLGESFVHTQTSVSRTRNLGVSRTHITLLVQGKRNLSKKLADKLVDALADTEADKLHAFSRTLNPLGGTTSVFGGFDSHALPPGSSPI